MQYGHVQRNYRGSERCCMMTKKRFQVQGMHCVGCAMTIDGALEDLPGVKSASASYARQIVDVEYDETRLTEAQIIAAVEQAGYKAAVS
ncbi:MAG: copper chaperone [Chloroflexi bacterium]|nr:copper chaperone [Chloroflexota bacterium]MDL1885780.1 heavy-metal-associated domain-containing protein [Anaerolineae bacterium CFX8]